MSNQLSIRELSKAVTQVVKNSGIKMGLEELQEMYDGRVMMSDFLAVKGIPVKCKKYPTAKLDGGNFSFIYQRIAAEQGFKKAFNRSSTGNLLWDLDFLNDNLENVKDRLIADVKIELFGSI